MAAAMRLAAEAADERRRWTRATRAWGGSRRCAIGRRIVSAGVYLAELAAKAPARLLLLQRARLLVVLRAIDFAIERGYGR